jgi:thiol-disulfide isomerase/thioredoxin
MRKIYLLIAIVLILASCNKKEQYTISGSVVDTTKTTIYLQQRIDGNWKNIDSARLINGKFEMKGKIDVVQEYYLSKSDHDKIMLFLENCPVAVTSDSAMIGLAKVKGGSVQDLYNTYMAGYLKQTDTMTELEIQWNKEQNPELKKKIEAKLDSLDQKLTGYQEKFMTDNPASPVAAYLLTRIQYGKNAEKLSKLLSKLDASLNKTESYKAMVKRTDALMKVSVGKVAPDFALTTPEEKSLKLSEVYSQNKLTLVDFWASWCGPCRAENPNVVTAFNKYNSKGFSVFGVSLDKDKDRWLKAISDDKLAWQHVSDLKGWNNAAAGLYAVNSIPANFLLDNKGTIIATNLRGEELMKKLEELLK